VLLRRLDGCNLEQLEASRHRGRSERKVLVDRTDDALIVERLTEYHIVQTDARDPIVLTWNLCRIF
jgi:hypothetical protein